MIAILTGAGRQLLAHWPAIMAWYLAGVLGNYVFIQIAGTVGAYSAIAGTLLLPLGILANLVAYIGMFLVVRDGMRQLELIAPQPDDRTARRSAFLSALLAAILPFVAFYAAWGLLAQDVENYFQRVLQVHLDLNLSGQQVGDGAVGWLDIGVWTIVLLVAAFGLRWLLNRYAEKLPRWTRVLTVYFELLWVYLAATLVRDLFTLVGDWVSTRQAMVWLDDARTWISEQLSPVAWVWDAVEWFIGEAGGILLLPLAWLTIAGVIYGQAVAPDRVRVRGALADRARTRWARVPGRIRARLRDMWDDLVSRFRPIGNALVLMWRAGPVLIGSYVLLYTLLLGLESLIGVGVTRAFGPNDLMSFWMINDQLILLLIPLIIEPLRIVLVSSSYDAVIGRLVARRAEGEAQPSGVTAMRRNRGSSSGVHSSMVNGPTASEGTRKSTDIE